MAALKRKPKRKPKAKPKLMPDAALALDAFFTFSEEYQRKARRELEAQGQRTYGADPERFKG